MKSAGWKLPRGVLFGRNKEEKDGLDRKRKILSKNLAKRLLKRQCSNLPPTLNRFGGIGIICGYVT